jgi:hypothetical protein
MAVEATIKGIPPGARIQLQQGSSLRLNTIAPVLILLSTVEASFLASGLQLQASPHPFEFTIESLLHEKHSLCHHFASAGTPPLRGVEESIEGIRKFLRSIPLLAPSIYTLNTLFTS